MEERDVTPGSELEIINTIKAGKITHNYRKLKAQVLLMVEPYKGLTFTAETERKAKGILAKLRKFKAGMNNERKNLKSEWMAPYLECEALMKEVLAVIEIPINEIDLQVKEFAADELQAKIEAIAELKAKLLEDHPIVELLHKMEWFNDPRWENKAYTLKKIGQEIVEKSNHIQNDINAIRAVVHGDLETQLISEYVRCGSLSEVLRIKDKILADREAAERAKETLAEMESTPLGPFLPQPVPGPEPIAMEEPEPTEPEEIPEVQPETRTIRFDITTTKPGFKALRIFCIENGIKIIPVTKEG